MKTMSQLSLTVNPINTAYQNMYLVITKIKTQMQLVAYIEIRYSHVKCITALWQVTKTQTHMKTSHKPTYRRMT